MESVTTNAESPRTGSANAARDGFANGEPTSRPTPAPSLPLERIASAPMPELLAEVNGQLVVDDELDDPNLFGGIVERKSTGRVFLVMPPRRPTGERDQWMRLLLAHRAGYGGDAVRDAFHVALHPGGVR